MSNGMVKYLVRENGITKEEAQKVMEERRNYRKYFKEEWRENQINKEENQDVNGKRNI